MASTRYIASPVHYTCSYKLACTLARIFSPLKRTETDGTERNGKERLENGKNGEKTGTERNGMERAMKRNGTGTERFL